MNFTLQIKVDRSKASETVHALLNAYASDVAVEVLGEIIPSKSHPGTWCWWWFDGERSHWGTLEPINDLDFPGFSSIEMALKDFCLNAFYVPISL